MIEILVKCNDKYRPLDINDSVKFTITYEIANIKDISASNGAYTKSLQLPNTANNREIFGFATNLSTDLNFNYYAGYANSFNPSKRTPCVVLEDTIEVLRGHIQLTKYTVDLTQTTIDVTIYADNANFYQSMGDSLLTDLDFSEYSFTYSQSFIQSTWNNDADAYRKAIYFPLMDVGKGYTLDDVNNPLIYSIDVKDFLPSVYCKTIWDKIYSAYSITVQSQFTGSNKQSGTDIPDERFGNLIIPFTQQAFQTGSTFSQDKIFRVGIDYDTIGQYTTYSYGAYQAGIGGPGPGGGHIPGGGGTAAGVAQAIFNAAPQPEDSVRYAWFEGELLNPWYGNGEMNTYTVNGATAFHYATQTIPFTLTASPMFDTSIGGVDTYDTTSYYYQNLSSIFKQRFVLNTDVVTTYSIDYVNQRGTTNYEYVMKVEFFRELDPNTGLTHSGWAGGTGSQIPADLGGAGNIAVNMAGVTDSYTHWICDRNRKSNCFDKNGTLIIPVGDERYLGKYCTTYRGDRAFEADGEGATYSIDLVGTQQQYPNNSGACITWYYSDATNHIDPTTFVPSDLQTGLWCSGFDNGPGVLTSGPFPTSWSVDVNQATNHPAYGDWYQQLQLQTIYLDNNPNDAKYGATGSIMPNGNKAIQPGEKVRCVVTFGSRYAGQKLNKIGTTITFRSYVPPVSAYLLSYTNFANDLPYPSGVYQYPRGENKPLTQFWNDVSLDYINGQWVDFNTVIPKNVKQRDFVGSIVRMHNLYIEPHKQYRDTLIIEPRNQYYELSNGYLDWSNKVDLSQPINVQVMANTQEKRTTFTYKNDNDWFNKLYFQETKEIYGEFKYILDNEYLNGEKKIETIFSPTVTTALYTQYDGNNSLSEAGAFIIPVLVNGSNVKSNSNAGPSGASSAVNHRILLKKYLSNQNSQTIRLFGTPTHYYPYAGMYNDPYNPTYTINWGGTLGEIMPTATDAVYNNLFNSYWSDMMYEIDDMNSRIVECQMFLTPKDIFDFQFYNQVYVVIDGIGCYYKVNSISDYTPNKNSTCKVELLKTNRLSVAPVFTGSIT